MGENVNVMEDNTDVLIDASKKVGLEVNVEKSEYMFESRHQSAGPYHNIKMAKTSFENVAGSYIRERE
jgi:hypothetical protein